MKNIIKTILFSLAILSFSSMEAQETIVVQQLSASEFKAAITGNDVQLIDVRTATEFDQGSITNAINIDYFQEAEFATAFDQLDKERPVYIFCRSGNRSAKAAVRLQELGFTDVIELKTGYLGWQEEFGNQ